MPGREIDSKMIYQRSFSLQEITANGTITGIGIDLQRANSVQFTITSGDITDGDYIFILEESDDVGFSSPSTVVDSDLRGAVSGDLGFDNTRSNTILDVGYVGNKRFVRWSVTSSSVTTGGFFSGTAILGNLSLAPTT